MAESTKSCDEQHSDFWSVYSRCAGTEEPQPKQITIEDATKVKEISIKVEFKGELLGESNTIAVLETGDCLVNMSAVMRVEKTTPQFMDDILANPLLFRVIDRTAKPEAMTESRKESKKESKKGASGASASVKSIARSSNAQVVCNTIGICNMDIGPLIKGNTLLKERIIVELDTFTSGHMIVTWPKLPRLLALVTTGDEPLINSQVNKLTNAISVTVESVFNAPVSSEEGNNYDAIIMLPNFGDKLNNVTFSNGQFTYLKDCECLKRWLTLPYVEGRGGLTRHKVTPDACDINPDDGIHNLATVIRKNGPRIFWNRWRSSVMVKTGSNFFFDKIEKCKLWPIEIMASRPQSQKNGKQDKRSKTASVSSVAVSDRYVAYLRLGALLYPGVTRTRVASRLYSYSPVDVSEKCGPEFVAQVPVAPPVKQKNGDKTKSAGKEPEVEHKDFPVIPLVNENGDPVFIVVEVEVWKPYIPEREPEYFFERFSSYFSPKGKVSKKEMNFSLARKNFAELIENLAFVINESYGKFAASNKQLEESQYENLSDEFINYLFNEGLFQRMKASLEDKVVDLIGETYGVSGQGTDVIPEIFVHLVDEIRRITNLFTTYKKRPLKAIELEANDLHLSAEEAMEEGNPDLAKGYLLQRISKNKLNPDYWLDYALFCITYGEYEQALESIREALLLDMEHQIGLLMYGLLWAKLKDINLAELSFQVLLAKYPDYIEGWMILHLFYSTIGYLEGADFGLQMATRLECERKCKGLARDDPGPTPCDADSVEESQSESCVGVVEGKYGIASFCNGQSTTDPLSWTVRMTQQNSLYIRTAALLLRLRAYEFAQISLIREALPEKRRQSIEYLYYLSVSHYLREQYSEAVSHLKIAVEKFGKDCFLWTLMGHCYYKLKNYENAIECFEYVIHSFNRPDDIHLVHVRMGIYYMKTGKFRCAKKGFLSSCKYSASSRTWLGLGAACYNLGEFEEAEAALTEANFLDPHCPSIWAYLTLINIQLQRYDVFELCYAETKKRNLKDEVLKEQIDTLMEVHRIAIHDTI